MAMRQGHKMPIPIRYFLFLLLLFPILDVAAQPGLRDITSKYRKRFRTHLSEHAKRESLSRFANGYVSPKDATEMDINIAKQLVKKAILNSTTANKIRFEKTATMVVRRDKNNSPIHTKEVPPLYRLSNAEKSAARLLTELHSRNNSGDRVNGGAESPNMGTSSFWLEGIEHLGTMPLGNDPNYRVFRNVKDYGAKGDGVTDDTEAINRAISDGNRCGEKCNGSTTKNAVIYFPSGTYLISSTIEILFHTQIIGNPNDKPIIKASPYFVGLGVLSTDKYVGGFENGMPKQYYVNTANFYRQIRNLVIDIQDADQNAYVAALHYQVAQATSLFNVDFVCSRQPGTTQQAIYAENGSGGYISDLTFHGGAFGFYGGAQQFTAQRLTFNDVQTAVRLIWDWGWTWQGVTVNGGGIGFSLLSATGAPTIGSVLIVDTVFNGVITAVELFPLKASPGSGTTGVTLDNVRFNNVQYRVRDSDGNILLSDTDLVDTWFVGPTYSSGNVSSREFKLGQSESIPRIPRLTTVKGDFVKAPYFTRKRPQYENTSASEIVQVKKNGVKGDGKTDDTNALQKVITSNVGKIIFVDCGSYILTDTIFIPSGSRIVGECWSQLVAYGDNFKNPKLPRPLFKVGIKGEVGTVEVQDILITGKGETGGLIAIEWNISGKHNGDAALWDTHVRLGGATGTDITSLECPASTNSNNEGCKSGSLMMHITKGASGLFENMWLWVADHDIDDAKLDDDSMWMPQLSTYVARGLLVESQDPVWLYGTSSEHAVMYQYAFYDAKNIVGAMIQTETPYYQPTPSPPHPFNNAVGVFRGDPIYDCDSGRAGCDGSWAVRIEKSSDIAILGAGLYTFFQTYTQTCVPLMNCQTDLLLFNENEENVRLYNLLTIGSVNMLREGYGENLIVKAKDNLAVGFHPFYSQLTYFEAHSKSRMFDVSFGINSTVLG